MSWLTDFGIAVSSSVIKTHTSSDGIFLVTTVNSGAGGFGGNDIFISKLDLTGQFVWARLIGTSAAEISAVVTTDSEGFVYVGANTSSRPLLIKLTASGQIVWDRLLGIGTATSGGIVDIAVDDSSVFVVGGVTVSGAPHGMLERVSKSDGSVVWAKYGGGTTIYSIVLSSDDTTFRTASSMSDGTLQSAHMQYLKEDGLLQYPTRYRYFQSGAGTNAITANAVLEYNGLPIIIHTQTSQTGTGYNHRGIYVFRDTGTAVAPIAGFGITGSNANYFRGAALSGNLLYVAFSQHLSPVFARSYLVCISLLNNTIMWSGEITPNGSPCLIEHISAHDQSISIAFRGPDSLVSMIHCENAVDILSEDFYISTTMMAKYSSTVRNIWSVGYPTALTASSSPYSSSDKAHSLSPPLILSRVSGYLAGG